MDEEYRVIYRDLAEFYRASQHSINNQVASAPPFPFDSYFSISVVSQAIDAAIAELGRDKYLRTDAKLFLLVNLHQMVALPVSARGFQEDDNDVEQLEAWLNRDARTIVRAAANAAEGREDIAASHVLWGTARVLDDLNLKSWRIWDRV